jgi:hypothetical protein
MPLLPKGSLYPERIKITLPKVDPADQRAFGRKGCPDQSTIARTLHACTAETSPNSSASLTTPSSVMGSSPRYPFHEAWSWVDADVTPMPIGAKAERELSLGARSSSKDNRPATVSWFLCR